MHGGWWRSLDPSSFSHLAAGANAQGVSVAVAGYDLCPQVSIAQIVEQMRAACLYLWRKRKQRIMVSGHSAGGHLTACMVATDWKALDPGVPADLVPAGYSISGVFDLTPLTQISINQDLRAVVGGDESSEFLRQSKTIAEAWRQGMVETRYEAVPGANHFTVIEPLGQGDSAMTACVVELAKKVQAEQL
ncbi:MAG: alpha/beta hydrolase [Pseudolabrys sp.]